MSRIIAMRYQYICDELVNMLESTHLYVRYSSHVDESVSAVAVAFNWFSSIP
jgi:hypothetical protein